MDRRSFIAAGISAFFFALMPWLRPKLAVPVAVKEYEAWANCVTWHLCRAYDLRWTIGANTNLLDEMLVHTGTTGGTRVTPAS